MSNSKDLPKNIRLALPKGRLLPATADLFNELALGFESFSNKTRRYRLHSVRFPRLSAKIFQEKDIPVQVAIGNYDLGICGFDWIEELLARYPASALIKISSLNYGEGNIYVTASSQSGISDIPGLQDKKDNWSIVSEYPNLAEAFALNLRLKVFSIFPIWGAAEVYPPEDADLAVLWGKNEKVITSRGLICLQELMPANAFLIANQGSLENKDLSQILACFGSKLVSKAQTSVPKELKTQVRAATPYYSTRAKEIKLALPDGHQQAPTSQFLKRAGIDLEGYAEDQLDRRPLINLDWAEVKVIRPQDMPLQVANGNFDLAITGEDWLRNHLYRFPSSPVTKLLDLGFGMVRIVAAVSHDMPVANVDELRVLVQSGRLTPIRVASEYVNIADKYLRDNRISPYKLIPTWGASEAFVPEDADLLIDNAQTGKTLTLHKLKSIDVLFESTACLIGNKGSLDSPDKRGKIDFLIRKLRAAL